MQPDTPLPSYEEAIYAEKNPPPYECLFESHPVLRYVKNMHIHVQVEIINYKPNQLINLACDQPMLPLIFIRNLVEVCRKIFDGKCAYFTYCTSHRDDSGYVLRTPHEFKKKREKHLVLHFTDADQYGDISYRCARTIVFGLNKKRKFKVGYKNNTHMDFRLKCNSSSNLERWVYNGLSKGFILNNLIDEPNRKDRESCRSCECNIM